MSQKNFNDTIGNRTHDLPVCSECLNHYATARPLTTTTTTNSNNNIFGTGKSPLERLRRVFFCVKFKRTALTLIGLPVLLFSCNETQLKLEY
jgi:hypothetical protein